MSPPLKNPPVYFTLVQVRFNAVLKLADYLPAIQEVLRKSGYPLFEEQRAMLVRVAIRDGQPVPEPHERMRYQFADVDGTHAFLLDPDALTLQSTNHLNFEAFSERFLDALRVVHDAVGLAVSERIGLRYLDRVDPRPGDNLADYLAPQTHGLNALLGQALGVEPQHAYSESLSKVGDVALRCRVVTQSGRLTFPPDLQPTGLKVQDRFTVLDGWHAIIDTDGSVESREAFSVENVARHLDRIHAVIREAFRAVATKTAFDYWEKG
jgi:uncharacterized protein (TIGR04255 family)